MPTLLNQAHRIGETKAIEGAKNRRDNVFYVVPVTIGGQDYVVRLQGKNNRTGQEHF